MSNKHWCMPKYIFPNFAREKARIPQSMPDKDIMDVLYEDRDKGFSIDQNRAISLETWLISKNTPCLFIANKQLVDFLYSSTFSLDIFIEAAFYFPFRWIVTPLGKVGGVDLRPVAFGHVTSLLDDKVARFLPKQEFSNEFSFYQPLPNNEMMVGSFTKTLLPNFLRSNERTQTISNVHKKICAAAAVYSYAFPDYIRDGLPDFVKAPSINKPRILTAAPEILEGATRTSVSMHIRAGHFKTLQHERFKRNDDGTPKVIFVRQTVVAGKLTPKTAVGL